MHFQRRKIVQCCAVIAAAALTLVLQVGRVAAQAIPEVKTANVTARLVSERIALQPGKTAWLALHLAIRPGWHTYWVNAGDAGEKTEIAWTVPSGFAAGEIVWPAPRRYAEGPVVVYGYEKDAVHLVPLRVPAEAKPGDQVTLKAEATWLVCEKICIPEQGSLALTLPILSIEPPIDGRFADWFDGARAAVPKPSPWPVRAMRDGARFKLRIDGAVLDKGRIADLWFYPITHGALAYSAPQSVSHDAKGFTLSVKAEKKLGALESVDGVLVIEEKLDTGIVTQAFAIGAPVSAAAADAASASELSFGLALILALAGGIILNLMPCVFPVLSMKALSFAAHAGAGRMSTHGLAYAGGVLACFAAIGAALIGMRGMGAEIGWGFQLQEPIFVAAMAYLIFAIGLNLSGLFAIGGAFMSAGSGLAARRGPSGSFFTGALAAVVATPCTAPFMGAALGYAITQAAPVSMAVMLALGLGMALPFLALSFSPALLRRLPKPGAWMERFKQFLAFPMYGTAAWLVWVLSIQAGDGALLAALAGGILIAFGLWLWEATKNATPRGRRFGMALSVVALLGAAGLAVWAGRGEPSPGSATAPGDGRWLAFSPEKLAAQRQAGNPVLVNFTAAWCVTCIVNEKIVLRADAVWAAMAKKGIVALKADWTRRDPAITRALAEHGRNGVPLYVLYPPAGSDKAPAVLPQILTEAIVLGEISAFPDAPRRAKSGQ